MKCRSCGALVVTTVLDLGVAPPSNAYLKSLDVMHLEQRFPLRVRVCENCWLLQTEDFAAREIFFDAEYAYFSSFSTTWLAHAEQYVENVVNRFCLNEKSLVAEIAANDGYLLQYLQKRSIPCYGVEPTLSTASVARQKGLKIYSEFFGREFAQDLDSQGKGVDLLIANNVFAHVPEVHDFIAGLATALKPQGVLTIEFPHLFSLLNGNQFDTVYHEHFSYWSLAAAEHALSLHGLVVFDVDQLHTHGGSLRLYVQHDKAGKHQKTGNVGMVQSLEKKAGLKSLEAYTMMQVRADAVKDVLIDFLSRVKSNKETIGAYGAAAKGNTLLNFAGIDSDMLPWVVDANPAKHGKYLPGSHIPIVTEDRISVEKPDWILILPWNIQDEIMAQLEYVSRWNGKFVTAIPNLQYHDCKVGVGPL